VATRLDVGGRVTLVSRMLAELGLEGVLTTPRGVEASERRADDRRWLFLINHTEQPQTVELRAAGRDVLRQVNAGRNVELAPHGVAVIELETAERRG
jgi:beta-galactosidase